ncbi:MAG: cysteine peptidase family C39 domain-containing protein, partial [Pseudomonadota bacterium]
MKLEFNGRQRLPVILQGEHSECGLACLAMVLNFHGHKVDLNTLRLKHGASAQGTTLKSLMQLADRLQLAARPLRLELEELAALRLPAILHWDMKHFVVLKAVKRNKVQLHDPAKGEVELDLQQLDPHFTGVALELLPTDGFVQREETRQLRLRDLWQRTEGLAGSLGQLLLLSLLLQLFALAL